MTSGALRQERSTGPLDPCCCILSPVFVSNGCINWVEVSKLIRFPMQSNGGRSSFTVNSVPSSVIR